MKRSPLYTTFVVVLSIVLNSLPAFAQWTQQGGKVVGTDAAGLAAQGTSISLSMDGNTAVVGGFRDSNYVGATWVFTRWGGVWTQKGNKLVGSGAVGKSAQGISVSLSSDGNTAIVGGYGDNNDAGAAWIFTREASGWSQQGGKLVGLGAGDSAGQGYSVAISSDGNTAIVGGYGDSNGVGAAWVFTRSGNVWTQQGTKLVGTGAVGQSQQGQSVSISSDGNTAIVGGYLDNNGAGAAWIFTRSNGVWTQQGNKLVGTGAIAPANQGIAVSLSGDGFTAMVGGFHEIIAGATWVFTRVGGVWTQQGNKLAGTGAIGQSAQGASISLCFDGSTALIGGYFDNSGAGAAWVFARTGGVWTQQGTKLVGSGSVGNAWEGSSVSISSDGTTAAIGGFRDNNEMGAVWLFTSGPTHAGDAVDVTPTRFLLGQNYPNPFNPSTTISYALPQRSHVILTVFNTLGQKVAELVNAEKEAGSYDVTFNAGGLASGVYLYRIQAGNFVETKKLILLR